ncbi:MAG: hypothetical protein EXR71_11990 [Myxococcales bacterium]|nr:hypothetical protein [Myxococcales bacterium]
MLALVSLLAGCTEAAVDDPVVAIGAATSPRHPGAVWTGEEAAVAMKEAVRFGMPTTSALVSTFRDMLSHGSDECPGPGWQEGGLSYFPLDGCTSADGYWYQGVGGTTLGWYDDDMDGVFDGFLQAMKTDGTMADPKGVLFTFGGQASFRYLGTPEGGGTYEAEFLGSYRYEGSDELWLSAGTSTGMYVDGTFSPTELPTMVAEGGFTVGGVSISAQGFTLGGACGERPSGSLGVRDDQGYWYDLRYDESTCDGCGTVWFDGREDLGPACVDVGPAFLMGLEQIRADMAGALVAR